MFILDPHILSEVKKEAHFWFHKAIQYQGTNSFMLQNMALAVIINTVVTVSMWLALSPTCAQSEASLENNRRDVLSQKIIRLKRRFGCSHNNGLKQSPLVRQDWLMPFFL